MKAVADFASQNGLSVSQVNLASRTVMLVGTCDKFAAAFKVDLALHDYQGKTYRLRSGAISIPQELSKVIESVHGLDNRPQAETHFRLADRSVHRMAAQSTPKVAPLASSVSYTPLQIAAAYSFPTGLTGKGVTIGIIELGGGFNQSDLNTYFSG